MPITIQAALQLAKTKLTPVCDNVALDAELLLAHALQKPRSYLHAWPEATLNAEAEQQFHLYLQRRSQREPLAYIIGSKEFWSLEFAVTHDVLIPRPETEILVEAALKLFSADREIHIADLGTGSGAMAIAIAHERPAWHVYATDVSEKALQLASKNAQRLMTKNVSFYQGSWCTALPLIKMDAIISNPPYLAETEWEDYAGGLMYEPRSALLSGIDGLAAIREIIHVAKQHLNTAGYLLIEHGFSQSEAVRQLFTGAAYKDVISLYDLSGHARITQGRL